MPTQPVCPQLTETPEIASTAFVAPGANVIGGVTLEAHSSVWYQCVLRADLQTIRVGEGSNLQDGVIVHLASDLGTEVGKYVTVGHRALLHACHLEDEVLIGMGAIVMDGARIGARSIVAAGAVVPKNLQVPPGSLVMGVPARVTRTLTEPEQASIRGWAEKYIRVAAEHRDALAASG
jgi:carbonic anhydrase/acetyltransferase-like protein (isoleucine patch superfamily)